MHNLKVHPGLVWWKWKFVGQLWLLQVIFVRKSLIPVQMNHRGLEIVSGSEIVCLQVSSCIAVLGFVNWSQSSVVVLEEWLDLSRQAGLLAYGTPRCVFISDVVSAEFDVKEDRLCGSSRSPWCKKSHVVLHIILCMGVYSMWPITWFYFWERCMQKTGGMTNCVS